MTQQKSAQPRLAYPMDEPTMYAVVCSEKTGRQWPKALSYLVEKQESKWPGRVSTIGYSKTGDVASCSRQLAELKPYYCCFLTHHSECSRAFVQEVNQLTRELDPSHPYTDTIWGILTGLTDDDVISALEQADPLVIGRVMANCPVDLEKFEAGVWFSEFEQGASHRKLSRQGEAVKMKCADDTTRDIVREISAERKLPRDDDLTEEGVDMIISSGHATEDDWNIAYCFTGGQFLCEKGQLFGSTVAGERVDVSRSKSPKVLSAAGNCLMGHISHESCMALGWMHSAGVVQMVGYVEPTWFGYGGWGMHKYLINNPGSMSMAEAFFANQQSLIHCLHTEYSEHIEASLGDHRSVYDRCFNTSLSGLSGVPRECSGLLYDQNNVVFYGDPAWRAQLKTNLNVYDYS